MELLYSIVSKSCNNFIIIKLTKAYIRPKEYTNETPILHRMMAISMCNFALHLRDKITSDSLYEQLKESPNLLIWMLACSGSDEQYFLNTCDTASSCVSILQLLIHLYFDLL